MRKLITFNPKGKTFCINLNIQDCCELAVGKCDVTKHMTPVDYKENVLWHNDIKYCHRIASLILSNGFNQELNPICIDKCICGHYRIDDGRHRVCIAAKLEIEIQVEMMEVNSLCRCVVARMF